MVHKLWIEADPTGIEALVCDPYVRHSCHGDTVSMSPADYGSHITRVTGHLRGTEIDIAYLVEVDDTIHARFTLRGMSLTTGTPVRINGEGEAAAWFATIAWCAAAQFAHACACLAVARWLRLDDRRATLTEHLLGLAASIAGAWAFTWRLPYLLSLA